MSETTPAEAPQRPLSVTVVVVIVWIIAILNIVAGIVMIFTAQDDAELLVQTDGDASAIRIWGVGVVIFGLIVAWVASALGRGGQFARFLISLLMILRILADVIFIGNYGTYDLNGVLLSIILALIVLALLWNSKASRFFNPA
ncbi:MAG: hypothetical protein K0U64_07550 [Actinomycetia bacterium]|nr:hypothetical protein [Actinomycetes bacterium]